MTLLEAVSVFVTNLVYSLLRIIGKSKIQQARLQREKDRTASQKNTEESEDVRPRRDHPKDSGMGDFLDHIYSERKDSTHKTNASHDNMHNNVTRNSGGDRDKRHSNEKGADDVKTRQSPQKDTVTLRQLEKDIFSDGIQINTQKQMKKVGA